MLKLAWRNIWRNSRRTFITMASVFAAVLFSILSNSLSRGSWGKLIDNMLRTQVGHVEIHGKGYWESRNMDYFMSMDTAALAALRRVAHVTNVSPRVETFAMASSERMTKGVGIIGLDPVEEERKSSLSERVVAGEYLRKDDDGVLLGEGLSEYLQVEVGDSIALIGQGYHGTNAIGLFPVRGVVRIIIPTLDNSSLYMSVPAAQAFINMPEGYSGVLVSIDEDKHQRRVEEALMAAVDTTRLEVLPWQQTMAELVRQTEANDVLRGILMFILYVIVGFGILGTVIMMTNERRHEFGVVVALGMKRGRLASLVCLELVFMTFMGVLAAIAVSVPITGWFELHPFRLSGEVAEVMLGYGMEPVIPMSTEPALYVRQALAVLVITGLTVLYPVSKIMKLKVTKAIRS